MPQGHMRALTLVTLFAFLAQSCTTVSSTTRTRLREEGALVFVRAPTPMIPGVSETGEFPAGVVIALGVLAIGLTLLGGAAGFGATGPWGSATPQNVTSRFGGPDPADLLAVATLQEWKKLGYAAPTISPNFAVRFEDKAVSWPAEADLQAEYLLHAQIDLVDVDPLGFPERLTASATLFFGGRAEVHSRCNEVASEKEKKLPTGEAWVVLIRRCAQALLAPYDDVSAPR